MKRANYTIIELLLVIAIAGIMLSVAVPSFSRMMKGSGPGLAAREIMGKINAARAYAASNRTDVAIIFPRGGEITNVKEKELYGYKSYRVCEVVVDGTTVTFKRWIPGENWKMLPKEAIVCAKNGTSKLDDDTLYEANTADEKKASTVAGITIQDSQNKVDTKVFTANKNFTQAIVIRSDGMLHQMKPVLIKIRQHITKTTLEPYYLPLVVRFNGKVKAYNEVVPD